LPVCVLHASSPIRKHPLLQAQGRDFTIFVLEQSPQALRFNRGMLLNAGVALLAGSSYDYFVFHDVDTTPTEAGGLPYDYPYGAPAPRYCWVTLTLLQTLMPRRIKQRMETFQVSMLVCREGSAAFDAPRHPPKSALQGELHKL